MKRAALIPLACLAACAPNPVTPKVEIPAICEEQVYADPAVKDIIAKAAGSEYLRFNTQNQLAYAKLDAAHRCLQQRGLLTPGGGVERRRAYD